MPPNKGRSPPEKTLALVLRAALSVEELADLTLACAGNPRLVRVARAAELALQMDGPDDLGRYALITWLYNSMDGVVPSKED